MSEAKVAVVTGAERGIGRALAQGLADRGCNVLFHYYESREQAEQAVREVENRGRNAFAAYADLSKVEDCRALIDAAADRWGKIDIVVNNAALVAYKPFFETSVELFDKVIQTNLRSVYFVSQRASEYMAKQGTGGSIVNISSVGGSLALNYQSHYCASKGAVIALTKVLAVELAPWRIRVNAVAPGVIHTAANDDILSSPVVGEAYRNQIPAKRFGKPEDLVGLVSFLCTDEADYITGQNLGVDGGFASHAREPYFAENTIERD